MLELDIFFGWWIGGRSGLLGYIFYGAMLDIHFGWWIVGRDGLWRKRGGGGGDSHRASAVGFAC
jgi:hypothetical protein